MAAKLVGRRVAAEEIKAAEAVALAVEEPTPQALSAFLDCIEANRRRAMSLEANQPGTETDGGAGDQEADAGGEVGSRPVLNGAHGGLARPVRQGRRRRGLDRVQGVLPLPERRGGQRTDGAAPPADVLSVLQQSEPGFRALFLRAWAAGPTRMVDDSPPMARRFKQWATAIEHHHELRAVPKASRLAFVIAGNWGPGLWLRADLEGGSIRARRGSGTCRRFSDPLSSMTGRMCMRTIAEAQAELEAEQRLTLSAQQLARRPRARSRAYRSQRDARRPPATTLDADTHRDAAVR